MRLLLIFLAALPLFAAAAPNPGERCKAREYHQFDFWLGDWDVFDANGQRVGRNRIEAVLSGCALAEHWTDASGSQGKSYNAFDARDRRWHQFWISETGTALSLTGGLAGNAMVLEGEQADPKGGKPTRQRITWTPNADGSVRQHWESSPDGAAWTTSFDGLYRLRKP